MNVYCKGVRCLIKSRFYPKIKQNNKNYKYEITLSIGGNIGSKAQIIKRFNNLYFALMKDKRFFVLKSSPIIKNAAFGYTEQADFLNAILKLKTSLYAGEILKIMQNYEKKFGRKRSFKNAPRTLDIDLVIFSAKTKQSQRLRLPHPQAHARLSVILPLALIGEIL